MKKFLLSLVVCGILLVPTKVQANSCYGAPCGYLMAGLVAGMVVWEVVQRYTANQISSDRTGYCPDERYPDGQIVQSSSCIQQVPVVQAPPQQRYFKKVWIPGSLQLQCSKGYYNFFGNFVPPECVRVWVPGYWELR